MSRIDLFIRSGQKIEAIKEYRTLHRVDLKTAKDAVEARERELGR
jgi:ribosomal protein L7/L12